MHAIFCLARKRSRAPAISTWFTGTDWPSGPDFSECGTLWHPNAESLLDLIVDPLSLEWLLDTSTLA